VRKRHLVGLGTIWLIERLVDSCISGDSGGVQRVQTRDSVAGALLRQVAGSELDGADDLRREGKQVGGG